MESRFKSKFGFWNGISQLFSIFDGYQNPRRRTFEDDARALRGDWEAVGKDIRTAMDTFKRIE